MMLEKKKNYEFSFLRQLLIDVHFYI